MNKLVPIKNRIIFSFLEDIRGNAFREVTKSGLTIVETKDKQLETARWAKVLSIGKSISNEIKEGMYILVAPLRWTLHIEYNKQKIWNTSENDVLLVSEEYPL